MKNIKLIVSIFVFLLMLNFLVSFFLYHRFVQYEKDFKTHKLMLDAYSNNHAYNQGNIYKIVNQTSDLPNGYRSYIVKGVRFVDDLLIYDKEFKEIDVPKDKLDYFTDHDRGKSFSNPEFITMVTVKGEEKTIMFYSEKSLIKSFK